MMVCFSGTESHEHLLFQCSFSSSIWLAVWASRLDYLIMGSHVDWGMFWNGFNINVKCKSF